MCQRVFSSEHFGESYYELGEIQQSYHFQLEKNATEEFDTWQVFQLAMALRDYFS